MSKAYGKVYLVGAGPGDAELITLKGYRLISQADVVLHDHLMPPELLDLVKPGAEVISVGKFAGQHTLPQDQMNHLIIEKAKEGKMVVRLKGGDPYIFGRGGEEAQRCYDEGIEFEVVPGISSAIAAACYAGIPATHRDYTSSVAIVTGHRKEDMELEIPRAGTVIFLMGVANLPQIIQALLEQGWAPETPIAAVEKGTCYDQRVVKGRLADFLDVAEKAQLRAPAVFIVGRVVELDDKLGWFARKPRIYLPGTHPQRYQHLGTIVHRPLIKPVPLSDYSQADGALGGLGEFDWVLFTSTNGVKFFFERLHAIGLDSRALAGCKVAAIGQTTAARLREDGILVDLQPELESSEGLVAELTRAGVKGARVLLVRPRTARNIITEGLAAEGAFVEPVIMYENIEVEGLDTDFNYIDWILFTSGSTVRAYVNRYGTTIPGAVKVYCLGRPTLDVATKLGIAAELLPS